MRDDTGTVTTQLERVNEDIIKAERLRRSLKHRLEPHEIEHIDHAVRDARLVVLKMVRKIEATSVNIIIVSTGTVGVIERVDWVLRQSTAVQGYQYNLQTCHQSLLGDIHSLEGLRVQGFALATLP